MVEDVRRLCKERGYHLRRIVFEGPDDLSPLVADLYRWWYQALSIEPGRLLAECFALIEPYWALRTGSVPYWLAFTAGRCAATLEAYLKSRSFEEIYLMLFSNGIKGIGMAPIERWRSILAQAERRGRFVGVDEGQFPSDYASFVRYHTELLRQVSQRHRLPPSLRLEQLDTFLGQAAGRYAARIIDEG